MPKATDMESKLSIESKKCFRLYLLLALQTKSALCNSDAELHIKTCKVETAIVKKVVWKSTFS